jgi:CheY-like chemotaxis protein
MKYIGFLKTFIEYTIKKDVLSRGLEWYYPLSFFLKAKGLALTQELVNLHDGKMEVESTFGHGTTFTIYIPIGNSHLPTSQVSIESNFIDDSISGQYGRSIVDEAERWGSRDTDWQSDTTLHSNEETTDPESSSSSDSGNVALQSNIWIPPSTQGFKILIVDDNADMRRFVKGVLLQAYEVLEASNGQIALAMATKEQPDLILSDMNMPGLNGFELLKVLRSLPNTRSIPFMLLSANADDKARVDGLLAGADDYLTKPFSPRELIVRVHTLLDNARMRIELEKRVREVSKDLMESEERFR